VPRPQRDPAGEVGPNLRNEQPIHVESVSTDRPFRSALFIDAAKRVADVRVGEPHVEGSQASHVGSDILVLRNPVEIAKEIGVHIERRPTRFVEDLETNVVYAVARKG
jgi:hypothetical protein